VKKSAKNRAVNLKFAKLASNFFRYVKQ